MITFSNRALKRCSLITVIFFILSMFGVNVPAARAAVSVEIDASASMEALSAVIPQLSSLQSKIQSAQSTVRSLETVCTPLHAQLMPSNAEAMSMAERVKAILNNARGVLGDRLNDATVSAGAKLSQGAPVMALSTDEQIAVGVNHLSAQAAKISTTGTTGQIVSRLKEVLAETKETLGGVVTKVREKIFNVGQKAGLISQDKVFEDGRVINRSESKYGEFGKPEASEKTGFFAKGPSGAFKGKLSQGIAAGKDAAKASLKNSFSFSNLAVTTTVAVGTNLAIDVINGEKPSFKKAVKSVASLEFAGNLVGSALGAAGGQFAGTMVKTFVPGVVGNLIGSVIPVMFSSASGQMASNLITGLKNGEFSVSKAFSAIDKADLVGSSIGSTIGMTLGAMIPFPVVGQVVGGIVGGFLGSKVAGWITGRGRRKKAAAATVDKKGNVYMSNQVPSYSQEYSGEDLVIESDGNIPSAYPGSAVNDGNVPSVDPVDAKYARDVEIAKDNYYRAFLQYNRYVQEGETGKADIMFRELKGYSDRYQKAKSKLNR